MYIVATVSDQVQCNHVAWAKTISTHTNLVSAREAAAKVWNDILERFEERPDVGEGAIVGESVIIHDGENCY